MLDAQFIRDNLDAVKANCRNRNVTANIDDVVRLDNDRRRIIQDRQVQQQRQNEIAKLIPKTKDKDEKQKLIQQGRELREQVAGLDTQLKSVEAELNGVLRAIPNMTHPDAPVGTTPADNKVIKKWGKPRKFDFKPRDHVAVAEGLNLVDFEAGAAVAGQKFYFLKNEAVLLELALVQYAFQTVLKAGYTPIITPDVAKSEVLEGIGFLPRGPETQIYSLENTDLCLIATAEITLGGMHRDQIFDELRAADQVRRAVALLPHRGRSSGSGHAWPVPRSSVHQGRNVRFHDPRPERGRSSGVVRIWRKPCSRDSACPTR